MPARTITALLSIFFACALLVAAPLPKPRGKEPEPDLIFEIGRHERNEGRLVFEVRQAENDLLRIDIWTPGLSFRHEAGGFCSVEVESKEHFWIYGGGILCEYGLGEGLNGIRLLSKTTGEAVLKKAPKGILGLMPGVEKQLLVGR